MHSSEFPFRLPLIAILRGITPRQTLAHVDALVEEGFDAIEIPTNSPDWQRSVTLAQSVHGRHATIGAGTVLQAAHLDALVATGATLAITPVTRPALIRDAVDRGLHVIAGFATPGEAFAAIDAGAPMLKLFPASVYGAAMVRALRSVLPPIPLFAVGGVTPELLSGYLSSGCTGAGIGGELYQPGQSVETTRARARRFIRAWQEQAA